MLRRAAFASVLVTISAMSGAQIWKFVPKVIGRPGYVSHAHCITQDSGFSGLNLVLGCEYAPQSTTICAGTWFQFATPPPVGSLSAFGSQFVQTYGVRGRSAAGVHKMAGITKAVHWALSPAGSWTAANLHQTIWQKSVAADVDGYAGIPGSTDTVVGYASSPNARAMRWAVPPGTPTPLAVPTGTFESQASAIDAVQIVGWTAKTLNGPRRAARWLRSAYGHDDRHPGAVIAGYTYDSSMISDTYYLASCGLIGTMNPSTQELGNPRAVYWGYSGPGTILAAPTGFTSSKATAICGTAIVGEGFLPGVGRQALYWPLQVAAASGISGAPTPIVLKTPPGFKEAVAYDVCAGGDIVVGAAFNPGGPHQEIAVAWHLEYQ